MRPEGRHVVHPPSHTDSYVVWDPATRRAAIIDPVLDTDPASGRSGTASAQQLVDIVAAEGLTVDWLLETHAHADHMMAIPFLKARYGAPVAIGKGITQVQQRLVGLFNLGSDVPSDGRQFDHLFADGEAFAIGDIPAQVIHTPGHTSDHVSYVIGDAVFVLHDYGTEGRGPANETTIGAERDGNIHVGAGTSEADFVALREARDATLPMPTLILSAVALESLPL